MSSSYYDDRGRERDQHGHRDKDRDRDRDRDYDDKDSDYRRKKDRHRDERDKDRRSRDRERRHPSRSQSPDDKKKHSSSSSKRKRETSRERSDRKAAERAAKKAAKKEEKDRRKAEDERQLAAQLSVYSGQDNPFHDANLNQRFVWGKKDELERKKGLSKDEIRAKDASRRAEAEEELAKLNRRRVEREREAEEREAEALRMARLQESAQMQEWLEKEDDFHLDQARRRAEIRIRDNRAKPIDLLAMNLKWSTKRSKNQDQNENDEEDEGVGLDIDLEEPYLIFDNLVLEEVEELKEDITMHLTLEKDETNREFWESMLIVCDAELEKLHEERQLGTSAYADRMRNSKSIRDQIVSLLQGKSYDELAGLQGRVTDKLQSGEPIDTDYWESLMKELVIWKAKAKLRDMHQVVLANRLEHLRERQRDEAFKAQAELTKSLDTQDENIQVEEENEQDEMVVEEPELAEIYDDMYTPELLTNAPSKQDGVEIVDEIQDFQKLLAARRKVVRARFVPRQKQRPQKGDKNHADSSDKMYQTKVQEGLDVDEEIFEAEEELLPIEPSTSSSAAGQQQQGWEEKYRPRKPRYFNKVHVGFDWNKYNQTHYDTDNPPPKVIQGYKFNIFYPDLIDKSKTPTYKVIKQKGNDDTCTLIFKAGPPYEDIAFQIVNKEWEYSHKRGFRCTFDRGVLQLHVTFKRLHYRK